MNTQQAVLRKVRRLFLTIAIGCVVFVALTLLAMLTYAGGSMDNHAARGYSFTHNFLSNLGTLTAPSGRPNWASAALFFIALAAAGACLVVFFVIFPRLFRHDRTQRLLSLLGSMVGVLAGISFMGIAFAPADVAEAAHIQFVMWAFRLFPLAVLLYLPVMFMDRQYPKIYAWVFAVFCLLLTGYFLLLTNGPSLTSPQGLVIQVVGQKVIAYASIVSIFIQSVGAYRFMATQAKAS
jgi:hypothetical membrane protein